MNKLLMSLVIGLAASNAYAASRVNSASYVAPAIVAGAVAGAAMSSAVSNASTNSASLPSGIAKMRVGRALLLCKVNSKGLCWSFAGDDRPIMRFVSSNGYTKVHNQYWYASGTDVYIVLEVSK